MHDFEIAAFQVDRFVAKNGRMRSNHLLPEADYP